MRVQAELAWEGRKREEGLRGPFCSTCDAEDRTDSEQGGRRRGRVWAQFEGGGVGLSISVRELPLMMSASEGEGGHGEADVVRDLP